MSYPDFSYLLFFLPTALIIYQLVHRKWRWIVLLVFSCFFAFSISKKLILIIAGTILFTYVNALLIERGRGRWRKAFLVIGIVALVGTLGFLKYYNFFADGISSLSELMHIPFSMAQKKLFLPIGISFYTLEAVGYLADIYWKKFPAEKNPAKFALFLLFFPTIMEGPICRYEDVGSQYLKGDPITSENLLYGFQRILWGMFKKVVIADRLNTYVNAIFGNYTQFSGMLVLLSAIGYTVQLYMEFSGEIDIVIGSARAFGIQLPENFRQPFFSKNASEFWRRWHISLGVWFKTYIFYPVSLSRTAHRFGRFGRKYLGKYLTKLGTMAIALFPVWLCNGLWHGARWNYLFYGMYYFVIIMIQLAMEPVWDGLLRRIHVSKNNPVWNVLRILGTWIVIFTGELFFRADTLTAGFAMFGSIFSNFEWSTLTNGILLNFGLSAADILIILAGCAIVAVADTCVEKKAALPEHSVLPQSVIRFSFCAMLLFTVILAGAYGEGYQIVDMIYANF